MVLHLHWWSVSRMSTLTLWPRLLYVVTTNHRGGVHSDVHEEAPLEKQHIDDVINPQPSAILSRALSGARMRLLLVSTTCPFWIISSRMMWTRSRLNMIWRVGTTSQRNQQHRRESAADQETIPVDLLDGWMDEGWINGGWRITILLCNQKEKWENKATDFEVAEMRCISREPN